MMMMMTMILNIGLALLQQALLTCELDCRNHTAYLLRRVVLPLAYLTVT